MEIVDDFDEKSYNNNNKPWKSSGILRVKSNFIIFSFFHVFHFFVFFYFIFFMFFIFPFIFISCIFP